MLEDDPALDAEIDELERRLDGGEIPASEIHSTTDVRRRLGLSQAEASPAIDPPI